MSQADPVLLIASGQALQAGLAGFLRDQAQPVLIAEEPAQGPRMAAEGEAAVVIVSRGPGEPPDLFARLAAARAEALLLSLEEPGRGPEPPRSGPGRPPLRLLWTEEPLQRDLLFLTLAQICASERKLAALGRENRRLRMDLESAPTVSLDRPLDPHREPHPGGEELKGFDKLRTDFISLIAHELRTPLSTIIGFAEILSHRLEESEEDFDQMVQSIVRSGVDLENFLNDAIEFLQWTCGHVSVSKAEFDLVPHLQRVIRDSVQAYKDKRVRVVFRGLNSLKMVGDARLLTSAIERLLDNGFKFSEPGGTVEISLTEESRPPSLGGATVVLRIRDYGAGLHRHQIETLFRPLEVRGDLVDRSRGHGLGLAIAQECLRSHGGLISVQSEGPQKGCLVSLELSMGRLNGPFEPNKILLGEIQTIA